MLIKYSLAVHIIIIISTAVIKSYHIRLYTFWLSSTLCKNRRNDEGNKGKSYSYEHQLIVIAFFAVILWFESDLAHGMIDILFIILISDLIAISICMHNSSMSVR